MTDLSSRVKRIISGSASALISAIEDKAPEVIMEEAVREVELAIDDVRLELGRSTAGKHLATKRLEQENKEGDRILSQIEVAISQGKDDLAKAGIEKKIDIDAQIPILESSITESAEKELELEGYIKALQAKRREMQADIVNFRNISKSNGGTSEVSGISTETSAQIKVDKASSAFDKILNRQAGLPESRGVSNNAEKLAELEQLSRNKHVEDMLVKLKAQHNQQK